jgi:hypothetical protein
VSDNGLGARLHRGQVHALVPTLQLFVMLMELPDLKFG